MDFFNRAFETVGTFFSSLSPGRKMAFIGMFVGIVVTIAALFMWAGRTTYTPLITNMTPEDSTSVIRYLRDKRIPFTVDEVNRSVSVPPEKVYDLRLELASSGLAQSGVVGYEVFDKQSFGATSTIQRINEQRAKEGELVRTFNHIKGVERSRVHLAIPQKSAFLEEEKKPTASVILDLAPSFTPSDDQVRGMQRMVAASIQGMEINAVTIISNSGKQLSQNNDDPAAAFAAANTDYQRKFEKKLEDKVNSLLGTVVGEGKVVARVNADFDFSRIAESVVTFDNENTAVRSTERDTDSMQGSRPMPGGVPGMRTSIPTGDNQPMQNGGSVASNSTNRNRESINYEVPRTQRNIEKPMATLKRLSVAVMVDSVPVADEKAPGGIRNEPVSEAKLAEFKSMIANSVGWDKDRDPPIEVKSISFFKEDLDAATRAAEAAERSKMFQNIAQWSAIGLIFTLFFLFVVRPFIKWVTENTVDSVEDFLPQTLEELEKVQSKQVAQSLEDILPEIEEKVDPEKVQSEMLKEKVNSLVNDNPHKASQILHEWIAEKPKDTGKEKSA
jgi:flagellar M-ring protein FliF